MPRRTTPSADRAHARFAPSAAYRWLNCPGSILLHEQMQAEPGYVEPPAGDAATLGQLLHTYAENALNVSDDNGNATYPNVTAEHRALIEPYVNEVRNVVNSVIEITGTSPDLLVEERFATGVRDCWGTVDAAVVCQATREAWIIDLKTGHQRVAAENNEQLLIYALGLYYRRLRLLDLDATQRSTAPWTFHLKIVQPRDEEEPIKSWTCSQEVVTNLLLRIREVTRLFQDGFVAPRILGDWCTYCPAASRCPEQIERAAGVFLVEPTTASEVVALTTQERGGLIGAPRDVPRLTESQLTFFLNNRAIIRSFLDACEERALHNPPPGWKVVAANTRRRWTDNTAVVQRLIADGRASVLQLIRHMPPTISDAERVLGRSNPIISELAVAPPGGPTLAPASDPRPSLQTAESAFRVERAESAERA